MPVTLTIKQVPDPLAEKLRRRAAASHRSLQGELLAILESAVLPGEPLVESESPPYMARRPATRPTSRNAKAHGRRLTLSELWERARRLGPGGKSESVAIVRALRDGRYGR